MSRIPFLISLCIASTVAYADIKTDLANLQNQQALLAIHSTPRLYAENNYSLAWQETQIDQLISAIENSQSHGLTPGDYHQQLLTSGSLQSDQRDIVATDAYLALAGHLLGGKLNPVAIEPTWTAHRREKDLVAHLQQALASNQVELSLEALAPSQPRYQILKQALAHYRAIEADGGWNSIDEGNLLKPGTTDARVMQLRQRLIASGDLTAEPDIDEAYYDEALVAAVKQFQRRANLEPDGIIGPATLRKLNRSPRDRVNQIRVNLERWRWLPEDLGYKHLRVNIANYELEAHEGAAISRVHNVVVGKTYRQTPIFSSSMSFVVVNPWWEVPHKLARIDILPKFQNDPAYFEKMGFQVLDPRGNLLSNREISWKSLSASNFPYRLRQQPGPSNALGQVKFMFPNEHNVYLHDTPSRDLYSKTRRDFSSGCIRVKDPIDLLEWVLEENTDWSRTRIESSLSTTLDARINLKQKIPVHLLYWTVVTDDETDSIRFVEDIYNRDERVLSALDAPPPTL